MYSGYRITRLLTADKRAWIYYLFLAAACFPLFFYVTFVYGEIPALTFCLAAIWMFLEYRKKGGIWWLIGCCITCALACLVRNNSLILLIAFVLVLLVTALGEKKLQPVLASVLLVAVFLGGRFCLRTVYEQRSGVEINDGAPMILYVAMGMQKGEGAPGWSNGYILHNYWGESDFDSEASTAMAIRDIGDSVDGFVENPGYAFWFYMEKFTSQWNDPTYECFAMTHINGSARGPVANSMFDGKLHALMTWFMNQYQSLIFIGVFCWLLFGFWKKERTGRPCASDYHYRRLPVSYALGGERTLYSALFCHDAAYGGCGTVGAFRAGTCVACSERRGACISHFKLHIIDPT